MTRAALLVVMLLLTACDDNDATDLGDASDIALCRCAVGGTRECTAACRREDTASTCRDPDDNDHDDLVDCADPDCLGAGACAPCAPHCGGELRIDRHEATVAELTEFLTPDLDRLETDVPHHEDSMPNQGPRGRATLSNEPDHFFHFLAPDRPDLTSARRIPDHPHPTSTAGRFRGRGRDSAARPSRAAMPAKAATSPRASASAPITTALAA